MSGTGFEAMHIIKSQILHIRSEDGKQYQRDAANEPVLTGFSIDLFEGVNCQPNHNFLLSLSSIEFPYSFYTTDSTNNQLNVKVQNTSTSNYTAVYTITIPAGNYNANTLKTKLITLLDTQFSSGIVGADYATTFSMTYDSTTNKFTFKTIEGDRKGVFTWSSSAATYGAYRQLGFTGDADLEFDSNGGLSDSVVNVGGSRTDALYVRTNLSSSNAIESRIKGISNVLQKVPITTPPNSFIFFDAAQVSAKILISTRTIQSITLRITDGEDRLINTNGVHFNISLQFDAVETPKYTLPDNTRRIGELGFNLTYLSNRFKVIQQLRQKYLEKTLKDNKNNKNKISSSNITNDIREVGNSSQ